MYVLFTMYYQNFEAAKNLFKKYYWTECQDQEKCSLQVVIVSIKGVFVSNESRSRIAIIKVYPLLLCVLSEK